MHIVKVPNEEEFKVSRIDSFDLGRGEGGRG